MSDGTTPRPWACNEVKTSNGRAFRIGAGEMLTSGPGACIIYDDYGHGANERASNAALIVRAVNSHDGLVKALEAIETGDIPRPIGFRYHEDRRPTKYDKCIHDVGVRDDCGNCIADFARSALSKAKGAA